MSTVTIAVDLAKNVFEIAVAAEAGAVREHRRLSRAQFEHFWGTCANCRVVMEACSGSHFWARELTARGFDVILLPPHYVKPYRRRNKTDRADCEAILEAHRCAGIHPVAIKSADQQALCALHRVRSQWLQTRTARINTMRALLREFGIVAGGGAKRFMNGLHVLVAEKEERLPLRVRRMILALWEEVRDIEHRVQTIDSELELIAREDPVLRALLSVPGIGPLTATALFAAVANIHSFSSGRQLACWLGLTPREHSSGSRRRLGRMSKQGDAYLRTLFIHGARSALNAARRAAARDRPLSHLQAWMISRAEATHTNKAAVAVANKLTRIAWAVWHHERTFDGNHAAKKAA
jgi:transposase